MRDFNLKLGKLKEVLTQAKKHGVVNKEVDDIKSMYDFKERKIQYYKNALDASIKNAMDAGARLAMQSIQNDPSTAQFVNTLRQLGENRNDMDKLAEIVFRLEEIIKDVPVKQEITRPQASMSIKAPAIPKEVREDMVADIKEVQMCFNNACYRSAVILCGRILETALHRKYYDVTGRDILETQPGIGLGTLIAKLSEKNVQFDPGLTQQIHLINQVRVYSVHKKQSAFKPTREQTQAMILYTIDVLNKLFK